MQVNSLAGFVTDRDTRIQRFKENTMRLSSFVYGIAEKCSKESRPVPGLNLTLLSFVLEVLKQCEGETILLTFLGRSFDHWDKIKSREISYFSKQILNLFQGLDPKAMEPVELLLTGNDSKGMPYTSPEERAIIWAYLESFVRISINYYKARLEIGNLESQMGLPTSQTPLKFQIDGASFQQQAVIWKLPG